MAAWEVPMSHVPVSFEVIAGEGNRNNNPHPPPGPPACNAHLRNIEWKGEVCSGPVSVIECAAR